MPRENEYEFLSETLFGCRPAVEFVRTLGRISQVLDDLIDKDNPVSDEKIIKSYWEAIIELPSNQFYVDHIGYLKPLIASAILDWSDSVRLEKSGGDQALHISFVLRDQLGSIISHCAYLLGGYEHMQKVSILVRQHIHEDLFADYCSEFVGEQA